jgi:hypothetical protein
MEKSEKTPVHVEAGVVVQELAQILQGVISNLSKVLYSENIANKPDPPRIATEEAKNEDCEKPSKPQELLEEARYSLIVVAINKGINEIDVNWEVLFKDQAFISYVSKLPIRLLIKFINIINDKCIESENRLDLALFTEQVLGERLDRVFAQIHTEIAFINYDLLGILSNGSSAKIESLFSELFCLEFISKTQIGSDAVVSNHLSPESINKRLAELLNSSIQGTKNNVELPGDVIHLIRKRHPDNLFQNLSIPKAA